MTDAVALPAGHALRAVLNDEVHARPPEPLVAPVRVSQLALLESGGDVARQAVRHLAEAHRIAPPSPEANHFSADFGPFRLKWERHTEFSRYTVFCTGGDAGTPAIAALPADWVASLPGELVDAAHVLMLPGDGTPRDPAGIAARFFGGGQIIGSRLLDGRGMAFGDFRIHADGFVPFVVLDDGMTPWQAGRIVQRLLEIETYRIMALLALPVARGLVPLLTAQEEDLAEITASLLATREAEEPALLERLTRLAAGTESREASSRYRFGAAAAYYDLVQTRIAELREGRIEGLQTFREFTERRLAPAMNTCRAVAQRQEQLALRIARATQLLSTRVDLTRQQQNQVLLGSLDRSARMQLRLQETVEGLSVAAISYYVVGMLAYVLRGAGTAGLPVAYDVLVAIAVPLVALLVYVGTRRLRHAAIRERAP